MGIKWMIKKSDFYEVRKSVNKESDSKTLEQLKKEVIAILEKKDSQEYKKAIEHFEKDESKYSRLEKSITGEWIEKAGYGVGTVRIWKGKKYKKIAQNKWVRVFDKNDRGAATSMGKYIAQVKKCNSVEELYQFCMKQRSLFQDENGNDLPIMDKLRSAIDKQSGLLEQGEKVNARMKEYQKEDLAKLKAGNYSFDSFADFKAEIKKQGNDFRGSKQPNYIGYLSQYNDNYLQQVYDAMPKRESKEDNPDYPFKPKTEKERAERAVFEKDRDDFIERMDKIRQNEQKKDSKVLSNGKTVKEVREQYGIKVDEKEPKKFWDGKVESDDGEGEFVAEMKGIGGGLYRNRFKTRAAAEKSVKNHQALGFESHVVEDKKESEKENSITTNMGKKITESELKNKIKEKEDDVKESQKMYEITLKEKGENSKYTKQALINLNTDKQSLKRWNNWLDAMKNGDIKESDFDENGNKKAAQSYWIQDFNGNRINNNDAMQRIRNNLDEIDKLNGSDTPRKDMKIRDLENYNEDIISKLIPEERKEMESEQKKHQNRSDAMKGNQNAYKGGPDEVAEPKKESSQMNSNMTERAKNKDRFVADVKNQLERQVENYSNADKIAAMENLIKREGSRSYNGIAARQIIDEIKNRSDIETEIKNIQENSLKDNLSIDEYGDLLLDKYPKMKGDVYTRAIKNYKKELENRENKAEKAESKMPKDELKKYVMDKANEYFKENADSLNEKAAKVVDKMTADECNQATQLNESNDLGRFVEKFDKDGKTPSEKELQEFAYNVVLARVAASQWGDKHRKELAEKEQQESKKKEEETTQKENEIKEKYHGYFDSRKGLDRSRDLKSLEKKYNYDGKVMSQKEFVEQAIDNGAEIKEREVNKVDYPSRTRWNRMTGAEQDAYERKIKEAGKKTIYLVNGFEIPKNVSDYAKFYKNKKSDVKKGLLDVISLFDEEEIIEDAKKVDFEDNDASQPDLFNSPAYKVSAALDSVFGCR